MSKVQSMLDAKIVFSINNKTVEMTYMQSEFKTLKRIMQINSAFD